MLAGEAGSLGRLYELHKPAMVRYGYKLTDCRDVIDDCIHDVFHEIYRSRQRINPQAPVLYYLLSSLGNRLRRVIKREGNRTELTLDYGDTWEESPEVLYMEQEQQQAGSRRIHSALGRLSRRKQEILRLRYWEDQSPQEIAGKMNLQRQATYNLLYEATRSMRDLLT